jgi:hypothetical protein
LPSARSRAFSGGSDSSTPSAFFASQSTGRPSGRAVDAAHSLD